MIICYTLGANLWIPFLFVFKPIEYLSIVAGLKFTYLLSERNEFDSVINLDQEEQFENKDIGINISGFVAGANVKFDHFGIMQV